MLFGYALVVVLLASCVVAPPPLPLQRGGRGGAAGASTRPPLAALALVAVALTGCQPKMKYVPGLTKEAFKRLPTKGSTEWSPFHEPHAREENDSPRLTGPMVLEPVSPEFRCMELGCPANVKCGGMLLVIVHCGVGKCKYCGKDSPVGNLVTKAWCSYLGLGGESAFGFITRFGDAFVGPICLPGESDNKLKKPPIATGVP